MDSYLLVLGLAALPATSNFVGGLFADVLPTSKRVLGAALHIAVGVLLAIIALELLPRIMQTDPVWVALVSLMAGGGVFILTTRFIIYLRKRANPKAHDQIAWIIFFSTSIHLLGGGLMIGTSLTIDQQLGWVLSLSRVIAHLPQGFATLAEFKRHHASRRHRLLLSSSFFVPMLVGATAGYWLLSGQSDLIKLATLAFTTGLLLTSVVEKIIPEAHEIEDTPIANLIFILSFSLFALVLTYITNA
jgi:ZIP family zinc transporter